MIVSFPLPKIMKYKEKRYDCSDCFYSVVLETEQFHVVLSFCLLSKTKCACMHRLNLAAKKKRKEELVYASTVSTKSSFILKDSLVIQKRKLKMTYFFIKAIGLGPRWFHCSVSRNFFGELEFHLPRKLRHFIFHVALIHLLKICFQVQYCW